MTDEAIRWSDDSSHFHVCTLLYGQPIAAAATTTASTKTQFASIFNIVIQMSNFVNVHHQIGTTHIRRHCRIRNLSLFLFGETNLNLWIENV